MFVDGVTSGTYRIIFLVFYVWHIYSAQRICGSHRGKKKFIHALRIRRKDSEKIVVLIRLRLDHLALWVVIQPFDVVRVLTAVLPKGLTHMFVPHNPLSFVCISDSKK